MSKPNNCISVDGKKFFSIETAGYWSDPLKEQAIYTRTFTPLSKEVIQFDTEEEMITEVKKSKYKFKSSQLSNETKVKFLAEGIEVEDDQGGNDDGQ